MLIILPQCILRFVDATTRTTTALAAWQELCYIKFKRELKSIIHFAQIIACCIVLKPLQVELSTEKQYAEVKAQTSELQLY